MIRRWRAEVAAHTEFGDPIYMRRRFWRRESAHAWAMRQVINVGAYAQFVVWR